MSIHIHKADGWGNEVFEYERPDGRKLYVIARYYEDRGQYVASMTREGSKATGCSQVCARTIKGLVSDPCVRTYASAASARRALKRMLGDWT